MTLDARLEALLFAAAKPLNIKRLAEAVDMQPAEVDVVLKQLADRLDVSGSGMMLQQNGPSYELVTRPEMADDVRRVVHDEAAGELSRPSLEALTILAYCGPLTRPELEQIRGVQSSMILRNLLLRGLIEEKEDTRLGQPVYAVSFAFIHHIGVPSVESLPDYVTLRGHSAVSDVLAQLEKAPPPTDQQSLTI